MLSSEDLYEFFLTCHFLIYEYLGTEHSMGVGPHQLLVGEGKSALGFLEQLEMGATLPSGLA